MLIVTARNLGTGVDNTADYEVVVRTSRVKIAAFKVLDYDRAGGWRHLLRLIADGPGECLSEGTVEELKAKKKT